MKHEPDIRAAAARVLKDPRASRAEKSNAAHALTMMNDGWLARDTAAAAKRARQLFDRRAKKPLTEFAARAWLRRVAGERVFWMEAGAGSTFGMPDACVVDFAGVGVWLELKRGKVSLAGMLTFRLRPEQKRVLKRLAALKAPVGVLVRVGEGREDRAVVGREACTIVLGLSAATYSGRVDLAAMSPDQCLRRVLQGPGSPSDLHSLLGCFM